MDGSDATKEYDTQGGYKFSTGTYHTLVRFASDPDHRSRRSLHVPPILRVCCIYYTTKSDTVMKTNPSQVFRVILSAG
jgi:hypothetical protein